jgi:alkylation response protein AidB-like acyl-CoA dehydrogenase
MNGTKAFVALAVTAAMGVLSATSADASFFGGHRNRGGFVVPCSLSGVNPAHHPDIFGNSAAAYRDFGFVQGPGRSWHVVNNCVRGLNHN